MGELMFFNFSASRLLGGVNALDPHSFFSILLIGDVFLMFSILMFSFPLLRILFFSLRHEQYCCFLVISVAWFLPEPANALLARLSNLLKNGTYKLVVAAAI